MGFLSGIIGEVIKESSEMKKSKNELELWKEQHIQQEADMERYYQKWLKNTQDAFNEVELETKVASIFREVGRTGVGINIIGCDFSLFNQLNATERSSDYMQKWIQDVKNNAYIGATKNYFEADYPLAMIMQILQPLAYFEEIKEEIETATKNMVYYKKEGNDIRSVLTSYDEKLFEVLEEFWQNPIWEKEGFMDFIWASSDAKELYNQGNYQEAFNKLSRSEYDCSYFDDAKKLLLMTAYRTAFNTGNSEYEEMYHELRKNNLFKSARIYKDDKGEFHQITVPIVDAIIADAISFWKAGKISDVDDMIKILLESGSANRIVPDDQYEVLRKVFAELKAYKQECMVLDYMIQNHVARTESQELRYRFLHNNIETLSQGGGMLGSDIVDYNMKDGQLLYEYRSATWSDKQIHNYYTEMSSENKKAKIPVVVSEWSNNLEIKNGMIWDIRELFKQVKKSVGDDFPGSYECDLIESSPLNSGTVEFEQSIYIEEKGKDGRFPWLSFLINGEQLTRTQVSLSIYVLYISEKNSLDEEDNIVYNAQAFDKVLSIKDKTNPKVNHFISTISNILIDELEKYLNGNIGASDLY